jgi:hypothetical protein
MLQKKLQKKNVAPKEPSLHQKRKTLFFSPLTRKAQVAKHPKFMVMNTWQKFQQGVN